MSRVIQDIATVQFQVNARQASASMQALQEMARKLGENIDSVKKNIEALGNVAPDNTKLLDYKQQLRGLESQLKDVQKTQRDFVKGAKAADQLWKAAQEQNIETLSMRSIKAGVSGLRKRQENLAADKSDPNNMRDFRIIQQVIDESERLMKDFRADVDNTIQVIRDGGTVSVQSMRNALKAAEELRDSVEEGTGEWRDYQQQVEFMTKSLDEYNAAQRRAKGEIVDANDARREALKLTEDGERAAAKERELADAVIAGTRQQINDYQQLRKFQQERIDKTEEEISTNLRLQEAEHARLAVIDKDMRSTEAEDRRSAKSYRDRSETESSSADWLDTIARNRDNEANQLRERVQNTQAEVDAIKSRIEALNQSANATKKNSKAYKELQELQGQLKDKTKELNTQTKDYEKALDRATKAQERANEKQAEAVQLRAKAENYDDKVAHAGENREKVLEREAQKIKELYMQYDQLDSRLKKERAEQAATDRAMIDAGNQQAAAEGRKAQAQVATVKSISNAIKILEEQNEVIDQNSKEWQENTAIIQRLQERLNEMKVAPALQMMTDRMQDVGSLSKSALEETRKFWEAMAQGADKGSEKLATAEAHIKALVEEEQKRNLATMKASADRLSGNLGMMSQGDIRQAIEDAKKYQLTLGSTSEEAKKLAQAIVNAEEHLKRYGVEAERAARKQEEADKKVQRAERDKQEQEAQAQQQQLRMMRERIVFEKQRQSLSADALAETKKYWEAVARGANEGSWAQKNALTMMERITAEEERRAKKKNVEKADRLIGTRYLTLSESELRESIEAAHELQKSLSPTESLYKSLSKQIAIAEEHIKKYGVEAQRVALREAQEAREAKQAFEDAVAGKFDKASMEELDEVIKKIKEYQATIKDPTGDGAQAFNDAKVQIDALSGRLNTLKGVAEKATGTFASADEVMARWAEHMNAGKTASEGMAQTLDEKLAGATSRFDDDIQNATESVEHFDKEIEERTEYISDLENELEKLEQKHANSSWFRKRTENYREEEERINELHDKLNAPLVTDDDGSYVSSGEKAWLDRLKQWKLDAEENLNLVKQLKAQELGLSEAETAAEEKKVEAQRLTNEQMQEGIKLLEEEYAKTDHTTEEGIKKREQLREAIDQMNQELKESTGEWMKLADAENLAVAAGKEGFSATPEQIQKATAAIERERDAVIKEIQAKKQLNQATDQEEAELADLTKKLRDLKFEQDNFNMSQEKMRMLMKQPANAVSLDELRAAIKRADGELKRMEGSLGENSKEYQAFAVQVKNAKNTLKEMEGQAKASATAWEKAWSRLKTYVVMYMGFNAVWQKITGTTDDLMQLSDKMGEVRKTTGFTADEVGRLSESLAKMDTRTSLNGLMELSVAAGQLGLKTEEDVLGFSEAANKLMVALPEMGKEGATEMLKVALATGEIAKIQKQMDEGLIKGSSATAVAMEKVGSTIDRLRATSAATAPAITDFVKRVGAVGAQSGISIDQVAALGSTVDALGMRVEMSATALSRMLPAIKNNAFDLAKILGVTPNTIRELYDTGRGMEVILMIFQHIKDAGMDADSIENMLGMGGMKEIMKELNQQGARAGIVFGGLSQNVDELRRQLGVAAQAYEENIAIQQEYDKMNETTAAKWERLKNQLEETLVHDTSQSFLGAVIDGLRILVNLLTENVSPALQVVSGLLKTFLVYLATLKLGLGGGLVKAWEGLKNMGTALTGLVASTKEYLVLSRALRNAKLAEAAATTVAEKATAAQSVATIQAKMAQQGLNKEMLANVYMAVAAAVMFLAYKIYAWIDASMAAGREAAKFNAELEKETKKVDAITESIGKARVKIEDTETAVRKARVELEAAKKANDGTAESVKRLEKAEADLLVKEEQKKNAMAEHKRLIQEFNTQYSKYLGFMLSEVASNMELARARELVNSKLRETITLKRREAAIGRIEEEYGEDRDAAYARLYGNVKNTRFGNNNGKETDPTTQARLMNRVAELANTAKNRNDFQTKVRKLFKDNNVFAFGQLLANAYSYYDEVANIKQKTDETMLQFAGYTKADRQDSQQKFVRSTNEAVKNYSTLNLKYSKSKGDARARAAADLLSQMDTLDEIMSNAVSYYDLAEADEKAAYNKNFTNAYIPWYSNRKRQREALMKEAGKYYTPRKKVEETTGSGSGGQFTTGNRFTGGGSGANIWGNEIEADSTEYSKWNVNELVERRNQMNKFKNVLKPGIDVRKVLAEDKALMKAINDGKVGADWESVLGWYNTERKKIQKELKSERFSTNEGNWVDEKTKKGRRRRNPFYESDYALAELDRYYSRRKEALEKARAEENITEEVFNRESELLEQEHLQKRSDLRKTFTAGNTKEEQEMVKQFRQWWKTLEEQGELDEVPWATVVNEWLKATANQIGRNNLKAQEDLTKLQSLVMKHVNQIAKIVNKERPYDGIVINLRKNLTELDVLMADWVKKGPSNNLTELTREQNKRLKFLLGEAEHAYTLTWVQLRDKMQEEGFGDWVAELAPDEKKRELLLQELRNTFDAIQQAIKKEASVIKNQVENIWNDMTPGLGTSMKDAYEIITAELGIQAESTSRANSLIGAGQASERVADKVVIKQMQLQLQMQEHYFNLVRQRGLRQIEILQRQQALYEDQAKQLRENAELLRAQKKEQEAIVLEQKAERVETDALRAKFDAQHALTSLNLSTTKEQVELDKQRKEIIAKTEESAQRLYKDLMEWSELLAGSVKSVFEASHAGDAEYYNEMAKMQLTGKGGPGAGTYIIIDNEGTEDATAHYEYLDQRAALERQREIERENAQAEAWRKVMDDINQKINDIITDQINAMMQDVAIRENTSELEKNTKALEELYAALMQDVANRQHTVNVNSEYSQDEPKNTPKPVVEAGNAIGQMPENKDLGLNGTVFVYGGGDADDDAGLIDLSTSGARAARKRAGQDVGNHPFDNTVTASDEADGAGVNRWPLAEEEMELAREQSAELWGAYAEQGVAAQQQIQEAQEEGGITPPFAMTDEQVQAGVEREVVAAQAKIDADNAVKDAKIANQNAVKKGEKDTDNSIVSGTQSAYAKMIAACNMYGIAYQAMSNDNLDTFQKFQMFALQAAGQTAIGMLTTNMLQTDAQSKVELPGILGKAASQLGPIAGPIAFAAMTALLGGLMGMAMSKVGKAKSQISQVTGASMSAGRLSTGMLTYAEGNVNEFTDPASLTPGRMYNVDAADGKMYRARYMGRNPKTHITNGPEFHLAGEAGREAIIDAHTTRLMQMDETGIWKSIQTLYNGGSISALRRSRRGRGVRAFADGNMDQFEDVSEMVDGGGMDLSAIQASLDRNSAVQEALLERLSQPIVARNIWTGPEGIPNMYNKMQKEAQRHGEKYL